MNQKQLERSYRIAILITLVVCMYLTGVFNALLIVHVLPTSFQAVVKSFFIRESLVVYPVLVVSSSAGFHTPVSLAGSLAGLDRGIACIVFSCGDVSCVFFVCAAVIVPPPMACASLISKIMIKERTRASITDTTAIHFFSIDCVHSVDSQISMQ